MRERILEIILNILKEIGEDIDDKNLKRANENSYLYGKSKILDSLMFVRFISELEEQISKEFNQSIVILGSDNLKSEESPFQSVISLADYIINILQQ
jgi:hypothetical protein